jgi:hypothetical protein
MTGDFFSSGASKINNPRNENDVEVVRGIENRLFGSDYQAIKN